MTATQNSMAKRNFQEFVEWGEIPSSFKCPLSRILMVEPMIDEDGHSYEKNAIETWLDENDSISPITGRHLNRYRLTINRALKNAIDEYREDLKYFNSNNSNGGSNNNNDTITLNLWFNVTENPITKYKLNSEIAHVLGSESLGAKEEAVLENIFGNVRSNDELSWFPSMCEPFLFKTAIYHCLWTLDPDFRQRIYAEFSQYLKPYVSYEDLPVLSPIAKADAAKSYLESLTKPHLSGIYALQDAIRSFSILYPLPYKVSDDREKTLTDEQSQRWIGKI
jgi:hypothetical protein